MDFVGQYKDKRKLAEALRKREAGLLGTKVDTSAIYTPESGAFPGQVQANWGGPLAQLGLAYFGSKAGDKAAAAESEAETARMDALKGILNPGAGAQGVGNAPGQPGTMGAAGGAMTPEGMMGLQELGLDPSVLKMLMPKEQSLGAITQAAATPAGRAALVQMGVWTQEQADKAGAAQDAAQAAASKQARDDYLFEQRNKTFAPRAGGNDSTSEFEYWMSQNPGGNIADFYAAKRAGTSSGKKGAVDPAAESAEMIGQLDVLQGLIDDPKNVNMFGAGQTSAKAAMEYAANNPSSLMAHIAGTIAQKNESPAAAIVRRIGTEQSFDKVKELYPASNSDIALARSLAANVGQSKEAAQSYIDHMRNMTKLYPAAFAQKPREVRGGPGQADGEGVGAGAGRYTSTSGIEFSVEDDE